MKHGKQAIVGGPMQFENDSLAKAWNEYRGADQEKAKFCFLDKINSFNHYSMVAYPVGIHQYYFKHGKESLENKILFCLNANFGRSTDRDDCLVGCSYV